MSGSGKVTNAGGPDPGEQDEATNADEPTVTANGCGPDTGKPGENTPYGAAGCGSPCNPGGVPPGDGPRAGSAEDRVAAKGVPPDPSVGFQHSPVEEKGEVK